jgi:chemotaxis protein MotB
MNSDVHSNHNSESIIIVRRRHDEDHGHHGGAWKIAYADFVTAMMAFFLVMWLINAANEKTKAQVASYFNPVKLTDTSTSKKGLNEPTKNTSTSNAQEKSTTTEDKNANNDQVQSEKKQRQAQYTEDEIFKNPYGVLAQLAGQAVQGAPPGHSAKGFAIVEIADPGHRGGEAYRDPFDPLAWKSVPEGRQKPATAEDSKEPAAKPEIVVSQPPDDPVAKQAKSESAVAIASPSTIPGPKKETVPEPVKQINEPLPGEMGKDTKLADTSAKAAVAIRQQLIQKLKQFNPDENPTLEVRQTKEGVLISLTDSLNFDMFAVGSAEPTPQLVVLMEKVAGTLRGYRGKIVIRGHTDARRFRNRDYDNWRLSTARAQMAYYMLIRAGVEEGSVERIEGYADRNLKTPDKPESAGNRRIEILLKVDEP